MRREGRAPCRRGFAIAAALLACLGGEAAPALAQERIEGLSAADLFVLADQARAAGRGDDAAAIYDALTRDADADVRAEARFRKGMMLADERRFADAAVAFRALLDEKPDAVRARLELARVLAAMGDEGAARRQLRQAEASGLPEDVAIVVEQFQRALRSTRPFGGSIEVALAPDSNVNRATQARTLDTVIAPLTLSEDARAQSGLGAKLSGQGYVRLNLGEQLSLLPRVAGAGLLYEKSAFNDISASALLGLERRTGRDRLSASVGQTWRWYGNDPYARTAAVAVDLLHPIGTRAQLLVHGGASRANYLRNDLQDGELYDASVGIERAVTQSTGFGLTLSGYRQTARDPGYAAVSGGISAFTWMDLGRISLATSAGVHRLEGDERLFLFPERRREWLLRSTFAATFRQVQVAGFAPVARLVLERNKSTVGLYDYRRTAVELGIVRAF